MKMWYLQSFVDSIIFFWNNNIYSVGRNNSDIIIENDNTISRCHGIFTIKNSELYITDLGSKYGAFVENTKLTPNVKHKLYGENIIKFGLLEQYQSIFKVKKLNLKIIFSNVSSKEKQTQYSALDELQIQTQNIWDSTCTHVVVSELILTSKILCALTMGQHIVNLHFVPDLVEAIKNNYKLPCEKKYFPKITETLLNKNIVLEYEPDRKILFKGLKFVFITENLKKCFEEVINTTGGVSISWCRKELNRTEFESNFDLGKFIFIKDKIEIINEKSALSQCLYHITKFLDYTGRRFIYSREIALAIIHNSISRYCNVQFTRMSSKQMFMNDPLYSKYLRSKIQITESKKTHKENNASLCVSKNQLKNNRLIKKNICVAKLYKLNKLFKNSIEIRYCPITSVTETILRTDNISDKNFKKFKKFYRIFQREKINKLNKFILRIDGITEPVEETSQEIVDDEVDISPHSDSLTVTRQSYQRRRFNFSV